MARQSILVSIQQDKAKSFVAPTTRCGEGGLEIPKLYGLRSPLFHPPPAHVSEPVVQVVTLCLLLIYSSINRHPLSTS